MWLGLFCQLVRICRGCEDPGQRTNSKQRSPGASVNHRMVRVRTPAGLLRPSSSRGKRQLTSSNRIKTLSNQPALSDTLQAAFYAQHDVYNEVPIFTARGVRANPYPRADTVVGWHPTRTSSEACGIHSSRDFKSLHAEFRLQGTSLQSRTIGTQCC